MARGRRRAALSRLRHFVDVALPQFGPHEDAMVERSWHLAHSVLSPYMNIGLLLPGEACDAVQEAFDRGDVPINSAEGFIRQVIAWREYVWGVYWLWMPNYRSRNALRADRAVPPVFTGDADTDMNCVGTCITTLHGKAYNHHIQRLMVLGNLADVARRRSVGDDGMDVVELHRRSRMGDAPQRDRHEPVGRWRRNPTQREETTSTR